MTARAAQVAQTALSLEEAERADLVEILLASLEQAEDSAHPELGPLLERRLAELESGAVAGVAWNEVRTRFVRGD